MRRRVKKNLSNYFLTHAKVYKSHGYFITRNGGKYPKLRGWKSITKGY